MSRVRVPASLHFFTLSKNNQYLIYLTGGGSGGHVFPLLSIIQTLKDKNLKISTTFLGRKYGIEKDILFPKVDQYISISSGKLRRYLDFKNITDFFKFILALIQCFSFFFKEIFTKKQQKKVLFSTGGFVSVPPVIIASFFKIPVIIHEQTTQVGLANKIASFFAVQILLSFSESATYFPENKIKISGYPIRKEIRQVNQSLSTIHISKKISSFLKSNSIPLILITGGGNGSRKLNHWIFSHLKLLEKDFQIIHQVGDIDFKTSTQFSSNHYLPIKFLSGIEWAYLLKNAHCLISRSGAGIVSECITLNKKAIFIPLNIAQKNEQFLNAKIAQNQLGSNIIILQENQINSINLTHKLRNLLKVKEINENNNHNNYHFHLFPEEIIVQTILSFLK